MRIPNILPMLLLTFSMAAQNLPCHIYDLTAQVIDCNNGQFYVKLDFMHENTGDLFRVQGNGVVYDTFAYNQVPVVVGPLAANGTTVYEFVVRDLANPDCQASTKVGPVSCVPPGPCEIYDVAVGTGDCTSDSTYQLKLNFKVANSTSDDFDLVGNGHMLGTFSLSQLPLSFNNFPAVAGAGGYVRICIHDNPNCCAIKQFTAPVCPKPDPCKIYDISVETGDCQADSTYKIKLNFKVTNPGNDFFDVWAGNGKYLGNFPLSQLPLSLSLPWGGGTVDKIKICINDHPDCCTVKEFPAPPCFSLCRIQNLVVETGDCTSDSTYGIWVKFETAVTVDSFSVWAGNGQFLGRFAKANLPLHLTNFPWGGGTIDAIKICISNTCCRTKEFNVPACLAPPCAINDLKVAVGDCTTPKTYKVELNFSVLSPNAAVKFEVWADNGDFLGTHSLSELPLALNFPWNGDKVDGLKVCLLNADGKEICCKIITFTPPDCVGVTCGIFNLKVETGKCSTDGTYEVWVNFQTPVASLSKFGIWSGTGKFLGFYTVADLPVHILKFPWSGGSTDKIIVCFGSACCETREFNAPDCVAHPCGIVDLVAAPGDCSSDSTYQLKINFHLSYPLPAPGLPFIVYAANGKALGTFNTANLPITIPNFPWNGNAVDAVKICVINTASPTTNILCCEVVEFKAPDCIGAPCGIYNLKVETGACNDDGTYEIWVNFMTTSAAGSFTIYAGNGQSLGTYSVADLPVHIAHFPGGGAAVGVVKVCLATAPGSTPCCRTKEFKAPVCGNPCGLSDLVVKTGDCTSDSTYEVWIDFKVVSPSNTTLFAVYANGTLMGQYPLTVLPLHLTNFPWNGGPNDVVKVCLVTPAGVLCCETKEFKVPDCLQTGPCEIYDLVADPGPCTSDSTYKLVLNFKVHNAGQAAKFGVWANGTLLGFYALSDLPLTIPNFPSDGGPNDVVKVCLITSNTAGSVTCCATKEFKVPDCLQHPCDIYDIKVETGACNDDGTYEVWLNFKVNYPPSLSTHFGVWANGTLLGFFPLSQLPLYIPHFPTNGGPNDVIKVCLSNTGSIGCCETIEFKVPDCLSNEPCKVYDLVVQTGGCTSDSTYEVKIDFKTTHPGNDYFEVWAGNGHYLGYFKLSDLPLVIQKFPWGGGAVDVIKICINDNPNCCIVKEFKVPDCLQQAPCSIYDLKVQTGDCNADGTYHAWVTFKVNSPGVVATFGVWANGKFLGIFPLTSLPLHIEHFPTDGGPNDVVKVCLLSTASTPPLCCATVEFPVPNCASPCSIYDLKVETGDCNDDGTYHAWVNFKVNAPASTNAFMLWANGQLLGTFPLSSLPLHIEHFPTDGGPNDVVKVCLGTPNTLPTCCATLEFPVPACLGNNCHIYDLAVTHTPCLCGQFFAILTFKFDHGGSGGFDIVGNGVNYGNFPYNQPQPIVLGPLDGDGIKAYEFVVRDHLHPDCQDAVDLGVVDCTTQFQIAAGTNTPKAAGKLTLAPNPTTNWISVTAQMNNGLAVGQATVEIRQADGRLAHTLVVPEGNNFQVDVSNLPAGLYRLSLQTATARLESTFAKQQ